jgi:hypothetical protein
LREGRIGANLILRGLIWGTSARVKRFAFNDGPA